LSKIFHSGKQLKYKQVRFQDLNTIGQEKGSFFELKLPVEPEDEKKEPDMEADTSEKRMDLELIKEEAYVKGKMDGHLEAEEKLHSATQALAAALEQISFLRKSLLLKSKEDMLRLIMAVGRHVIHTEIEEKEGIILQTLTKTLQSAVQADKYYIRVNPEDLNIVRENEPLFLASMKGLKNIYFLADDTISRGGCFAESQVGEVDATIESQLTEIFECLRKEIL
jgi:flagellar assembly protein FliH